MGYRLRIKEESFGLSCRKEDVDGCLHMLSVSSFLFAFSACEKNGREEKDEKIAQRLLRGFFCVCREGLRVRGKRWEFSQGVAACKCRAFLV